MKNGAHDSKYGHIRTYIKEQLREGGIKPGRKLPSIRDISVRFGCSKNTAIRAYDDLEKEHLIYSVPKSGYYALPPEAPKPSSGSETIDLSSAAPDPEAMPYEDYRHCLNRAIELYQDQLFSYNDPQGFYSLRQALERHLAESQVFAPAGRIGVVSGSQQALHLLAAMPFPNGKSAVLVEQPTYSGMLRTLELLGVPAIGIARTEEGVDAVELERHFRSSAIKCFYTVPRFHNPLGSSYSPEQKKHIARLAEKYGVYVIEDDYLADLETGRRADPIYSYDASGHTVYVKSFSKVMLPGLRLAAVALPDALVEPFRQYKASCDAGTAALSQAALEMYLTSGMYGRHAAHMRERYRSRMSALRQACARWLPPEVEARVPESGIFAQLTLPARLPAQELAAALAQRGVLALPTDRCYLRAFPKRSALRVSVIRADEEELERGVRLIGELAEQLLQRKKTVPGGPVIDWL